MNSWLSRLFKIIFVATVASNFPNSSFDFLRKYDRSGISLPNWRFFAPNPAIHDFEILVRSEDIRGEVSDWRLLQEYQGRRLVQILWSPRQREQKALFDMISLFLPLSSLGYQAMADSTGYRVFVRNVSRILLERHGLGSLNGFQFLIARSAGYDESVPPEFILQSPFIDIQQDDHKETR